MLPRIVLLLLGCLCFGSVRANMASPVASEGTKAATALSSRDVDILSELLVIQINRDWSQASYEVVYRIRNERMGNRLPLLFVAKDYRDSFRVLIDGVPVNVRHLADSSIALRPDLDRFQAYFSPGGDTPLAAAKWYWNSLEQVRLNELKYFEGFVDTGLHTIRVRYAAAPWALRNGRLRSHEFLYSLSPAKRWRSFGMLTVRLMLDSLDRDVTTNLGAPVEGRISRVSTWVFASLPGDAISINGTPDVGSFVHALIVLTPETLTLLIALFYVAIHLRIVIKARRKVVQKRWSRPVLLGSLLMPILVFCTYCGVNILLELLIPRELSGTGGGYFFLAILFYPLVVVPYASFVWGIDMIYRGTLLLKRPANDGDQLRS